VQYKSLRASAFFAARREIPFSLHQSSSRATAQSSKEYAKSDVPHFQAAKLNRDLK
jgi:hypothetical protein